MRDLPLPANCSVKKKREALLTCRHYHQHVVDPVDDLSDGCQLLRRAEVLVPEPPQNCSERVGRIDLPLRGSIRLHFQFFCYLSGCRRENPSAGGQILCSRHLRKTDRVSRLSYFERAFLWSATEPRPLFRPLLCMFRRLLLSDTFECRRKLSTGINEYVFGPGSN